MPGSSSRRAERSGVKRGALVLTIIAGVAVFLVVLFFYLPASWFTSALPAQVKCRELGGSIWQGECLGLSVQDTQLGDATWDLAPGRALTGRLAGVFELRGAALTARGDLELGFSGAGEVRNLNARLIIDPALLRQLPPQQRGTVSASLERLELTAGPALHTVKGTVELRDFRQVGAQPMDLGSYQVTFDGAPHPGESLTGKLRDLGGPFAVDGTVTLNPPDAYLVQGFITGRTAAAGSVVREITLGAAPDASGRSAFSFEGTY